MEEKKHIVNIFKSLNIVDSSKNEKIRTKVELSGNIRENNLRSVCSYGCNNRDMLCTELQSSKCYKNSSG